MAAAAANAQHSPRRRLLSLLRSPKQSKKGPVTLVLLLQPALSLSRRSTAASGRDGVLNPAPPHSLHTHNFSPDAGTTTHDPISLPKRLANNPSPPLKPSSTPHPANCTASLHLCPSAPDYRPPLQVERWKPSPSHSDRHLHVCNSCVRDCCPRISVSHPAAHWVWNPTPTYMQTKQTAPDRQVLDNHWPTTKRVVYLGLHDRLNVAPDYFRPDLT
jgi:hypothetical protein